MVAERTPPEFARAILEHRNAGGSLDWALRELAAPPRPNPCP
jgi:hypothetical protein